jgi:hypothetical protein
VVALSAASFVVSQAPLAVSAMQLQQMPLRPSGSFIVEWSILDVAVEVDPGPKLEWILAQEPTAARVKVACPIFVDSCFWIELTLRVLEVVPYCPG